jgi:dihydroorotate dehydrogenase
VYKALVKPLLFRQGPERVHDLTFYWVKWLFKLPFIGSTVRLKLKFENPSLVQKVFGLTFKNPIGLAAGFDKDAKLIDEIACLGFGFIEIGTLTPKPQVGNPQPRLFRLPKDEGIINRMGFNNGGVTAAVERLKHRKTDVIIGGNIGKNKDTPNEEAVGDYLFCLEALHPYVDYFVLNVSSPNTPNLRELQEKEPLKKLLTAVKAANGKKSSPKPILLKIAPDLTEGQLDDIVDIVLETGIDGIIATNTTLDRSSLSTPTAEVNEIGAGGLSGTPVKDKSTAVIRYLASKSKNRFPIIGVGGVFSVADAIEKLEAGASLIQVYTGMIYEGPSLVNRLNKGLAQFYRR